MSLSLDSGDLFSLVRSVHTIHGSVYHSGGAEVTTNKGMTVSVMLLEHGVTKYETKTVPKVTKWALIEHYAGDVLKHINVASARTRMDICKKLLCIILDLHANGIMHGSICAENVKLNSGTVTLKNAGLFVEIQRQVKQVPLLPCTRYRPKEELEKDEYVPSKAADLYSLSVLFYAIFAGEEPYASTPLVQVVSKIARDGHTGLQKPVMMPPALWRALKVYWKASFESREEAFGQVQAALA